MSEESNDSFLVDILLFVLVLIGVLAHRIRSRDEE